MATLIEGVVPVMLTPFTADDRLDGEGLERLVDWYLANGSTALFAVCQSSEMQKLSLDERVNLSRMSIKAAGGKVPVIVSGHISDPLDDQVTELLAMAATEPDAVVLVTNHLDPKNEGTATFRAHLDHLLAKLPQDMPLGLYECPAPYRRLLTDEELKICADTGRFIALKDVACDLDVVKRRLEVVKGSPLAIVNANAAIALDAMRAGSTGFCGVFNNIHPDLYHWAWKNRDSGTELLAELEIFLALSAMAEGMGYPGLAKRFHVQRGTFASEHSRVTTYDISERHWAVDKLLAQIVEGGARFRAKIAA